MKVTILFNNEAKEGFRSGWGFSALVEKDGKSVLFDTGCDGGDLLYNMEKLSIDPAGIDYIVLSHQHHDHTGGLFDTLKKNSKAEVFLLPSFPEQFKGEVMRKAAKMTEVSEGMSITEKVHTTGPLTDGTDEQALAVETEKGLVVLVGCSHPGLDRLLEKAEEHGEVYAVIGGFHGFSDLKKLEGIRIIGACHCTQKKEKIKKMYPDQSREILAGDIIDI